MRTKHPRVVGVSLKFQEMLRDLSPKLYKNLLINDEVRKFFYIGVKNLADDAFNHRRALYNMALAIVSRAKDYEQLWNRNHTESASNKREVDASQRHAEGGRIALEILEERANSGENISNFKQWKGLTRDEWKTRYDKKVAEFPPLSEGRIQREILAPMKDLLPPKKRKASPPRPTCTVEVLS
jgi:hypothetical protein